MQVVILCGGKGTRLREETEYRPKPMVPIGNHPILWHIMKIYSHFGHNDFVLCLGYKGQVLKDYFVNYRQMASDFTVKLGSRRGASLSMVPPPKEKVDRHPGRDGRGDHDGRARQTNRKIRQG